MEVLGRPPRTGGFAQLHRPASWRHFWRTRPCGPVARARIRSGSLGGARNRLGGGSAVSRRRDAAPAAERRKGSHDGRNRRQRDGAGILPVIGFRPHSELYRFARPVRPLGTGIDHGGEKLETPGAIAAKYLLAPVASAVASARMVGETTGSGGGPEGFVASAVSRYSRNRPGRKLSNRYFVDSPAAPHVLFGLQKNGELTGYFCLAFASHVARIADLWLPSTKVEDWCAGFRAAAVVAAREKRVYEVSAWALDRTGQRRAFPAPGFLLRGRSAVSLFGDAKILEGRELAPCRCSTVMASFGVW